MRKTKQSLSRRSTAANRMKKHRAKFTQEQLAASREASKLRAREKRANETPEEREQRHMYSRLFMYKRRNQKRCKNRIDRQNAIIKKITDPLDTSHIKKEIVDVNEKKTKEKSSKPKGTSDTNRNSTEEQDSAVFLTQLALELIEQTMDE